MQLFVNSHIFIFNSIPTVNDIKEKYCCAENIPSSFVNLSLDGLSLNDDSVSNCCDGTTIRASVKSGLCGGKGGFGAMLRSLAKQKGKTKTTDFGACRDLSGRRLRHINDEIILNKWKQAQESGETFDTEEETATGIDLWYLSAPSWAEGIKVDKRKKFLKPRMKTTLCIDWERARSKSSPPDGAPLHWGCPRGPRCEFAHGENELRGDALAAVKLQKEQTRRDEAAKKRDDYLGVVSRAAKEDEEVQELVIAGLRAAKRAKIQEKLPVCANSDDSKPAPMETLEDSNSSKPGSIGNVSFSNDLLQPRRLSGEVEINGTQFEVRGSASFGSACAPFCHISESGRWYYEVQLRSNGLMQIGWASSRFLTAALADGDGVGDDEHSWGYDGYRQRVWHKGEELVYGPQTGVIWQVGDVVGCTLQLLREGGGLTGVVSYSVNGVCLGEACRFAVDATSSSGSSSSGAYDLYFVPALSLESEEVAAVNLGQAPFEFPGRLSPSETTSDKKDYTTFSPVWKAVAEQVLLDNGFAGHGESSELLPALESEPQLSTLTKLGCNQPPLEAVVPDVVSHSAVCLEDEQYASAAALESLGMAHLKSELERRGLKVGGTLKERAERLHSVRGLTEDQIDKKLFCKSR